MEDVNSFFITLPLPDREPTTETYQHGQNKTPCPLLDRVLKGQGDSACKRLGFIEDTQPLLNNLILIPTIPALTLAYSEHFGAAGRAHTLRCRLTVLHSYASSVLHLPFGAAFHAVGLHRATLLSEGQG